MSNSAAAATLTPTLTQKECACILNEIFKNEPVRIKMKYFKLTKLNGIMGFLSDYFSLEIGFVLQETLAKAKEQQQLSQQRTIDSQQLQNIKLFVKSLPSASDAATKHTIFHKETLVYDLVLAELQKLTSVKFCANCYYKRFDLLVLEDLLEQANYVQFCHTNSFKTHEVEQILRSLTIFHGTFLIYKEQINFDNLLKKYENLDLEITIAPEVAWCTTGLNALVAVAKNHAKYQTKSQQNFITNELEKNLQKIYAQVNVSKKYTNVFCHRDLWSGNVFFAKELTAAAVLVDFQTCRYCPPVIDIILVIYLNLSREQRKLKTHDYLQFYYKNLCQILAAQSIDIGNFLTETELYQSYEELKFFGCVYRALVTTLLGVPREMVTDAYKNVERAEKLLVYMEKNVEFRNEMYNCVEEIMEMLIESK